MTFPFKNIKIDADLIHRDGTLPLYRGTRTDFKLAAWNQATREIDQEGDYPSFAKVRQRYTQKTGLKTPPEGATKVRRALLDALGYDTNNYTNRYFKKNASTR